jgi:peptidylprolyl isomerase
MKPLAALIVSLIAAVAVAQPPTPPSARERVKEVKVGDKTVKLRYYDLVEGDGAVVKNMETVEVHYTMWLDDGTKVDSSHDRKQSFTCTIGVGQVIKGMEEGVVGMKVGTKRFLIVPPELGYGAQGAGKQVPPNAVLKFEVELLRVVKDK